MGDIDLKYLFFAFFLFVCPVVLGMPWTGILPKNNIARLQACLPIGFFIELGMLELILFPFGCFQLPFSSLCISYVIILAVCCAVSLYCSRVLRPVKPITRPKITALQGIYIAVFIVLLGIQLYNGYRLDTTYMSFDDAIYVAYANDALYSDRLLQLHPNTGLAAIFDTHRALQAQIFFPAVLSYFSSVPVAVLHRTVLEMYNIALAYMIYGYLGTVVFRDGEDVLIFLVVMCVLHIFGYYSHYSLTFRMLGPNNQGKAIAVVSFFPLLFALFIQKLGREYDVRFGALLMLLSAAAVSLSMFSAATMIVNSCIIIVLNFFRRKRSGKQLLYIIWSSALPALSIGIFMVNKYLKW